MMIREAVAVVTALALAATVPSEQTRSGQGAPASIVEQKSAGKKTQLAATSGQKKARAVKKHAAESQGQGGAVAPGKRR